MNIAEIRKKVARELKPYLSLWKFGMRIPHFFKVGGTYQYSVIVTGCNTEENFDFFITCLVNQKLKFSESIFVYFVDNGSTDGVLEVFKKWHKKFPNNLFYIPLNTDNKIVARNSGLKLANTPWITFFNGEDFVDDKFFYRVDKLLREISLSEISLISCYSVEYNERFKRFKRYIDIQKLKTFYQKGIQTLPIFDLSDFHLTNLNGVFFKTSVIKEMDLKFEESLEVDASELSFIGRYLEEIKKTKTLINPKSYYFSRVTKVTRALDDIWNRPQRYLSNLVNGPLRLVQDFEDNKMIQRMVFAYISDYVSILSKAPEKLEVLSLSQKEEFEFNFSEVLKLIDENCIRNLPVLNLSENERMGILGRFKGAHIDEANVVIENYDPSDKSIQLTYYSYFDEEDLFLVNGKRITPSFTKRAGVYFIDKLLFQKKIVWLRINENERLLIEVAGKQAIIHFKGKEYQDISSSLVINYFRSLELKKHNTEYRDAWLFMDRDTQADDNAEHLYRYVSKKHPEIPAYFALRKTSHDWTRLQEEGFRLVDMNSDDFKRLYRDCKKIISSHIDPYVIKFLGPRSLYGKKYIFLQHGVIKDDLSKWLNKKRIDCFITSTNQEYESIVGNYSPYFFGKKEVLLSGLPRHDRLLQLGKLKESEKIILVMPTWRMNLVGENFKNSNDRMYNKHFMESQYAKSWQSFLCSDRLRDLAETYNYRVIFFPHANTQRYLKEFNLPDYIQTYGHEEGSIQNLFLRSRIMITDYSSVAFEMGIQKKEVIYYQFDEKEFFSGSHLYKKGYFDYRRDGFGPVCSLQSDVLSELTELLKQGGHIRKKYQERVLRTFTHIDGENCKRVFNHIK